MNVHFVFKGEGSGNRKVIRDESVEGTDQSIEAGENTAIV